MVGSYRKSDWLITFGRHALHVLSQPEFLQLPTIKSCEFRKKIRKKSVADHILKPMIGARHRSDLHPSGYWTGNDVYLQLAHVITIFEITHPGK